jgi:autotransporter adhesin
MNRQITNVAPGTGPNDAATFGQLNQGMHQTLGKARQFADTVGALSMAAVNAAAAAAGSDCGPNRLAVGVGSYNGQAGFAVSYQQSFTRHWDGMATVASNGTSANTGVGAGAAYSW